MLLLLVFAACAPARTEPGSAAPVQATSAPQGTWFVTLTTADLGEIRVPMHFEAQRDGRFQARSRAGVLGRAIGSRRALLARLFGGKAFSRGALLHIVQGESEARGDTVHLRGRFLSAVAGQQNFSGTLVAARISGE